VSDRAVFDSRHPLFRLRGECLTLESSVQSHELDADDLLALVRGLPDPVEKAVESREGLAQRLFVPGQKITARPGVRAARPGDAQAAQGLVDGRAAGQLQRPGGLLDWRDRG
jgi:hypothetical protein